jgi:hypothetical protein
LQAGVGVPLDSWSMAAPTAATSKEQIAAAQLVVKDAQEVLAGIAEIEDIRPRTPEFMMLKVGWQWKLLMSQLLAYGDAADRKKAANDYLAAAQQAQKLIEQRVELDAGHEALDLAKFAVADAQYIVAALEANAKTAESKAAAEEHLAAAQRTDNLVEQRAALDATSASIDAARHAVADARQMIAAAEASAAELTPAQRDAAENLLAATTVVRQDLETNLDVHPKTPEFVELILQTVHRQAEVGLLLAKPQDLRAVLDKYAQDLAAFDKRLNEHADAMLPEVLSAVQFARAEADFMRASAEGSEQKNPTDAPMAAAAPSNAAAAAAPVDGGNAQLVATIYELHLPAEQITRLDMDALAQATADAEFEKALAIFGEPDPIYHLNQPVRLAGDRAEVVMDAPYVAAAQTDGQGRLIEHMANHPTGAIFDLVGKVEDGGKISLTMQISISAVKDGTVEIAPGVPVAIFPLVTLKGAKTVDAGKPLILLGADGDAPNNDGKAIVYIARVQFGPAEPAATPAK